MKILVLSDTHGYIENARDILNRLANRIDMVFHLGDHDADMQLLEKEFPKLLFHGVKGNNDYGLETPSDKLVRAGGKTFLLTHGHKHRVYYGVTNLAYWAEEKGADVVLFGHTHSAYCEYSDAMMIVNPGSVSIPRDSRIPTFAILTVENGEIACAIMEYHGKETFLRRN